MRHLLLALLFASCGAFAAETKHGKDLRECKIEAAKAPVKNPADVKKVQREALNKCLRSRSYATSRPRS